MALPKRRPTRPAGIVASTRSTPPGGNRPRQEFDQLEAKVREQRGSVPMWMTASNAWPWSGQPKTCGTRMRWPDDETGRNSVRPCTIPRTRPGGRSRGIRAGTADGMRSFESSSRPRRGGGPPASGPCPARRGAGRVVESAMPKTAGIVLVGNEILSGKIVDANASYLCRELRALGVEVRRISVIPDEVELIAAEVARVQPPTTTSSSPPAAWGRRTTTSPSRAWRARRACRWSAIPRSSRSSQRYYKDALTEAHLKMAEVPEGAELLADESVRFPTILMRNVYILPGVPEIFRRKFDALRERFRDQPIFLQERVRRASARGRSPTISTRSCASIPSCCCGSYPEFSNPEYKVKITLESRDLAFLDRALAELLKRLPADVRVRARVALSAGHRPRRRRRRLRALPDRARPHSISRSPRRLSRRGRPGVPGAAATGSRCGSTGCATSTSRPCSTG